MLNGAAIVALDALSGPPAALLAEDVYRTDDAAGAIFRVDTSAHDAGTIGVLDDDFPIAQSQAGRENVNCGTFRMRC